jgi:DNA-nicking Smr family endonuclease
MANAEYKLNKKNEINLFMENMDGVTPMQSDKYHSILAKPRPYPKQQEFFISEQLTVKKTDNAKALKAEDQLNYTAEGLQKNVLKKMRKGHYGLDAELDLHGLTSAQAKREFIKFLHFCVQDNCRCVRIIHGKGYRSQSSLPVLKNDINFWLRQHQEVQAFCSTSQKDGGTGAVFVLLRLSNKYTNQDSTEY